MSGDPHWEVPWPAGLETESWSPERAKLAMAFVAAIRKTGSLMQLMSQAAADRIGINATDLNCLNILSFSGQLTAGELAKATGLTTASITGVDRPARAGRLRPPRARCGRPSACRRSPERAAERSAQSRPCSAR